MIRALIPGIVAVTFLTTPAFTSLFEFTCGNVEYTLDTQKSTMSDRFNGISPVNWTYDGTWLLWRTAQEEPWSGVNVVDGSFIFGGVPDPSSMCWMPPKDEADEVLSSVNED